MWKYPKKFDVIVIGAGHAGCEAAYASAKMGAETLLLTMNLDTIAKMSCNPSIGGTAKGHIVREIDALGGIMGKIADQTSIHSRMLNASKGPAVRSPRAQIDKSAYHLRMKNFLEKTPHLEIKQGSSVSVLEKDGAVYGVETLEGVFYEGKTIVLTTGTFLKGVMFIGKVQFPGGRLGCNASSLSPSLQSLGLELGKLKTGTPPRIHKRSIDFSLVEMQPPDQNVRFSYDDTPPLFNQIPCYITYTTEKTKAVIQRDLHTSALFSGIIKGKGPRYCPSIEDKIVRFADKERHQVFLEPEGINTEEFYVNGVSSSMPFETQLEVIRSIIGLENAEIMRPAYAIEYDYVKSGQIEATLETKKIKGLFLAGQINGTTGYEEAAAQGLIAGINAALKGKNRSFTIKRSEGYIGVMIDDLITKELDEPYRMFTSRAEYRLLFRQDNADLRLRSYGYDLGLINQDQQEKVLQKKSAIEKEISRLKKMHKKCDGKNMPLSQFLCRPEIFYQNLLDEFAPDVIDYGSEINEQIEIELKFEGYLSRQQKDIEKLKHLEKISIPPNFPYAKVNGLRNEAREKLLKFSPRTLDIASRISGISPSDISILMISLRNEKLQNKADEKNF